MSFSCRCALGLESGGAPAAALAHRPGLLREIVRFLRTAGGADAARTTLDDYVRARATRAPSATSTWCPSPRPSGRPPRETLAFPVSYAVRSSRTTACWASAATGGSP